MNRRFGPDILKRQQRVILVNDFPFDLPFDDRAEKTIGHGVTPLEGSAGRE
jgi:hypothetical protein